MAMATVAPAADQTANLLQNLSLDSQPNEPTKETSVYQYGNIDSRNSAMGQFQSSERLATPFPPDSVDPTVFYLPSGYHSPAYLYGGYDGNGNDWDPRYVNANGVEMTLGAYGDSGSVMYHNAYGYAPYGPYSPATSPVPTMGNDGQLHGHQQYQYTSYCQPLTATSAPFTPGQTASSLGELSITTADQKSSPVETGKANSIGNINNGSTPKKSTYRIECSNTYGRSGCLGYQDAGHGYEWSYRNAGVSSTLSKTNNAPARRKHKFQQNSSFMGFHQPGPMSGMGSTHRFVNGMYPNKFYGQYGNAFRSGMGDGSSGYDSRINPHGWLVDSKYARGRGNGFDYCNENIDGLNELNKGPRAKSLKNEKGFARVTLLVKGQNIPPYESNGEEKDEATTNPDWEQYNCADFPEVYADAKLFIIKSYSEDDVHKSIKYNVWASTPNGNKKLNAAYLDAQQKSSHCPVFLFFSVNTSGQFVGLAEMLGPVDFEKNVDYWQQDKWTGYFPVKWHIVKDIPNSLLKHIILENNDNKPVTNSRDTQEVNLKQGLKMIKIFKDHSRKTCILHDFGFYEKRQKIIQEKKVKQQQFQKQALEGERKENKEFPDESHKSLVFASNEPTSTVQSNGEVNRLVNGLVAKNGDASNEIMPVSSEKTTVAKQVANGC